VTIATWYNRCALWLTLLAILAYSTASGAPEFAVLAMPTVYALWKLSGRKVGRFLLPRFVVNILLFAVLAFAALRAQGQLQVETIAQVIVLIQVIKLGDRRAPRDDAQILCLTVFLAIAAMLDSNDVWTGALLIVFLPLLVMTVMLFQVHKGEVGVTGPSETAVSAPIAGLRRAVRGMSAFATVGTLGLALVVFVLMPRGIGENALGEFGARSDRKQTGFTSSVTLGARGIISSSPTVVFDLVVKDFTGANVGSADTVQYMRGAVLTDYESRKWTTNGGESQNIPIPADRAYPFEFTTKGQRIEQVISMRSSPPADQLVHLFAMWRPVQLELPRGGDVRMTSPAMVLQRRSDASPFEYTVWSVPFEQAQEANPNRNRLSYESSPRLRTLASTILTEAGIEADPLKRPFDEDVRATRAIQDHLRTKLAYTLEQESPPRDVDPVEHFLFDRKAGHCEYFASAMVLLCRSVGINARMVTGYIATEFSPSTGAYTVRESNAHAWVEAEDEQGRWKKYDSTPPEDLARIHKPAVGLFGRLRQAIEAVEYAWNSSIVAFNERTRQNLLGPSRGENVGILGSVEAFSRRVRESERGSGLILSALINGLIVFAGVAAGGFVLSRLVRRLPQRRRSAGAARPVLGRIRFYRALLRLLARQGRAKPHWRPPLDHAAALAAAGDPGAEDVREVAEAYYRVRFGGGLDDAGQAQVERALRRVREFRPARA
jgi:protein-glutamine gamma-glutamyltransferase